MTNIIEWNLAGLYDNNGLGKGPFGVNYYGIYTITGPGGPYQKTWIDGLKNDRNCNEFNSSMTDRINQLFSLLSPPITGKQFIVVNDPSVSIGNLLLMYPLTTDAMNYSFNMKPQSTATPNKFSTVISSSIWPPNTSTSNLTLSNNIINGTSSVPIGTNVGNLKTCNIDTDDFSYSIIGGVDASKFSISGNNLLNTVSLNNFSSYTIIIKSTAVGTTDAQYIVSNTFNISVPTSPPTPIPEPISNRPGPIQYCTSRFAKCNITKKTSFSSGNVTIQGTTNARRQSLIVNQSTYRHGAKLVFSNQVLNAYGRTAGGPGGFGAPPRNHF
jgi:hypothetical protein